MLLLEDTITKMVNALDIPIEFGYNLVEEDSDYMLECVEDDLRAAGFGYDQFTVNNGVSKVVIIPNNSAYVIKTPLFGSWYAPEIYNEEYGCYEYDYENQEFEYYCGAYSGDDCDDSDYCCSEEYYYMKAEDAGVAEMFASTRFFTEGRRNRPMYISEKCRDFFWDEVKPSEKSKTIAQNNRDNNAPGWCRMSPTLAAKFIDDYGEEKANKLFNFLHNEGISDLHSGNIMISDLTGKVVIVDYSGFNS